MFHFNETLIEKGISILENGISPKYSLVVFWEKGISLQLFRFGCNFHDLVATLPIWLQLS
jgi:hypothetical protein